jgi:hypothetical protein
VPANKTTAKNTKAKRAIASKATAKKTTATKTKAKRTGTKARSEKATTRASDKAQPGDLIIIDSPQVGSPPREGEILKVTVGAFSVSYQVRWGDGRETTISPGGGTARIVRS